jgi:hypothetical protein
VGEGREHHALVGSATVRPRSRRLYPVIALLLSGCRGPAAIPARDISKLEAERDHLREKLAELRGRDERLHKIPAGGVLIGVPVATASDLLRKAVSGFLDQIEVALVDLAVHTEGTVTARTFLGKVSPGAYTLDVKLEKVQAVLQPGEPRLAFQGNRVQLEVPVTLARGEGRAQLGFKWDARGISSAVCGDFQASPLVTGRVRPDTYRIKGGFDLSIQNGQVVAVPRFPDLLVRLVVEPSEQSWSAVDQIVATQSLQCRTALKMIDLRKMLAGILAKGFQVRIPRSILKPVQVPAGVEEALQLEGKSYVLNVEPRGLTLDSGMLWYGADLRAKVAP